MRSHIPERTLRAATICALLEIPHEIAKAMTEAEVLALVEYDHYTIRKADGGTDQHFNLRPLLRPDHKLKTRRDAADMAHERKVRRSVSEHMQRMLLKGTNRKPPQRSRWPKRAFPRRIPK